MDNARIMAKQPRAPHGRSLQRGPLALTRALPRALDSSVTSSVRLICQIKPRQGHTKRIRSGTGTQRSDWCLLGKRLLRHLTFENEFEFKTRWTDGSPGLGCSFHEGPVSMLLDTAPGRVSTWRINHQKRRFTRAIDLRPAILPKRIEAFDVGRNSISMPRSRSDGLALGRPADTAGSLPASAANVAVDEVENEIPGSDVGHRSRQRTATLDWNYSIETAQARLELARS